MWSFFATQKRWRRAHPQLRSPLQSWLRPQLLAPLRPQLRAPLRQQLGSPSRNLQLRKTRLGTQQLATQPRS